MGAELRCRPASAVLALALLWLLPLPASAAGDDPAPWYAGKVDLQTGVHYREGDYGRVMETRILYLPVSVRYRFQELGLVGRDQVHLAVTVPYLRVDGPERGNATSPNTRGTDEGLGDVNLKATYVHVPESRWLPQVYLSGKLKLPTADEREDLGTGETDFTPGLALRQVVDLRALGLGPVRAIQPVASVGYKIVGSPPNENRRNAWRASAAASLKVGRHLSAGFRYGFRESTIPSRRNTHEAVPYLGVRVTPWLRVSSYAVIGLSERAPDWGAGMTLKVTRRIE